VVVDADPNIVKLIDTLQRDCLRVSSVLLMHLCIGLGMFFLREVDGYVSVKSDVEVVFFGGHLE